MAGYKIGRVTHEMQVELSNIIRELKDPRISSMLSIVKVNVTNDLSFCTVYVSTIEGFDAAKKSVEGLKSASGFIKREISRNLKLRKCPELIFQADDSIEYGAKINKIFVDMNKDK